MEQEWLKKIGTASNFVPHVLDTELCHSQGQPFRPPEGQTRGVSAQQSPSLVPQQVRYEPWSPVRRKLNEASETVERHLSGRTRAPKPRYRTPEPLNRTCTPGREPSIPQDKKPRPPPPPPLPPPRVLDEGEFPALNASSPDSPDINGVNSVGLPVVPSPSNQQQAQSRPELAKSGIEVNAESPSVWSNPDPSAFLSPPGCTGPPHPVPFATTTSGGIAPIKQRPLSRLHKEIVELCNAIKGLVDNQNDEVNQRDRKRNATCLFE